MADIANKDVFRTLNDSTLEGLRKRFGPPEENPKLTAQIAVGLMQLSLLYFVRTGAPKSVVREFFDKLMDEADPTQPAVKQDGNRLVLSNDPRFSKKAR